MQDSMARYEQRGELEALKTPRLAPAWVGE